MQIINNRTRINHKAILIDNFAKSDKIIIVSPFLSSKFDFFPFDTLKHLKNITLLTTLKPKENDQVDKVKFFRELLNFGKNENITIEILIDNSLHGKIYICQQKMSYFNAIITSANFTSNGLRKNNEWGICIDDQQEIEKIANDLIKNVVLERINDDIVKDFERIIGNIPKPVSTPKIGLSLVDGLKLKTNPLNISSTINYWLKPIGASGDVIAKDREFDEIESELYFSKINPSGVKQEDILIAYAVGHSNILSIYRVKSKVMSTNNPIDRWPYYVIGENLTPYYGKEWNKYDITVTNQKQDVINSGQFHITPSGKDSYGSLMHGADKLKITKQFADFMIDKIVKINDDILTIENT